MLGFSIMRINTTSMSCGVRLLTGIWSLEKDPQLLAKAIRRTWGRNYSRYGAPPEPIKWTFIFSDNVSHGNGKWLADYIKKNKLGTVTASPETTNANMGDTRIKTWIWDYNGNDIVPRAK